MGCSVLDSRLEERLLEECRRAPLELARAPAPAAHRRGRLTRGGRLALGGRLARGRERRYVWRSPGRSGVWGGERLGRRRWWRVRWR